MSVSLSKGARVTLTKNGQGLAAVRMGLGWDVAVFSGSIDLDASATALDNKGNELFTVYFGRLRSPDNTVIHTGDNLTGAGSGDDESILVDLLRMNARVAAIYFTVCSYSGQPFKRIKNASCHLVSRENGRDKDDLGTFTLSGKGDHTAIIMARVVRARSGWVAEMIGAPANAHIASALLSVIQQHMSRNPVA